MNPPLLAAPAARQGRAAARRARSAAAAAAVSLCLPAAVLAQSTVTIYGIIDQGIVKPNSGTTPGSMLPGRGASPDTWTIKAGNTSRLGFRGREDLGDGAYARFQIEHRFAADTGTSSNATVFWLGRSVVAAGSNKAGEVFLGREYSPAYWIALQADPTYWSYVSQLGSAYGYANYTPVPGTVEASNIRWANMVGYTSPNWGGLTFQLANAFGENQRSNAQAGNVQYKQGPLWIGAGFDRLDSKTKLALVGASYSFGPVQVLGSHARAKGGVNGDGKSVSLSAMVPLSLGRVYASYAAYRPATNRDSSMFGAGAQYDLSKRTLLYLNIGSARQKTFTRTTAFDLGIKHTF